MKLSDNEKRIVEQRFDSFCKKTLRNAKMNIQKKEDREKENVKKLIMQLKNSLEGCTDNITLRDKYPSDLHQFNVDQYQFGIENEKLAKALLSLPDNKRNIILLKYFWDMTDDEIANYLKQVRTTVMRQRTRTLSALKQKMEKINGKK